jgi:hypothetical protein
MRRHIRKIRRIRVQGMRVVGKLSLCARMIKGVFFTPLLASSLFHGYNQSPSLDVVRRYNNQNKTIPIKLS